ncbi:hypothetical protein DFP72DRAFT_1179843 [Ephemerocybe angulata]|uniref:MYND-type domain-containing protein n=1 Tax=Ephemerocybe angulata TaxID=980116 RepID=A0A8H6H9V8_9AGAR|nr:hypothetical protein DFP72DRAFT_1179843 [Tulosesus angulatus]
MSSKSSKKPQHAVPKATLEAARQGSLKHLEELMSALPEGYDLDVLEAFLRQLEFKPASQDEEKVMNEIQCAMLTMDFICALPICLDAHPGTKLWTVHLLNAYIPLIVTRMTYYLKSSGGSYKHEKDRPWGTREDFNIGVNTMMQKMYQLSVGVLKQLLELDPLLKKNVLRSGAMIEAVVALWVVTIGAAPALENAGPPVIPPKVAAYWKQKGLNGPPGFDSREGEQYHEADRLLEAFYHFIQENGDAIMTVITRQAVCPLDTFVDMTLRRIGIVTAFNRLGNYSNYTPRSNKENYEIPNIGAMVEVTNHLMCHPKIREAFFRQGAMPLYMDCLTTVRNRLIKDHLTSHFPFVIHWASHVIEWSIYSSGSLLTNMRTIIKSGIIHIVLDSFSFDDEKHAGPSPIEDIRARFDPRKTRTHEEGAAEDAKFLLCTLLNYAGYPRFLGELRRQMASIPPSRINRCSEDDERRILYDALLEEVNEESEFLKRTRRVQLCDNLDHDDMVASSPGSTTVLRIGKKQQTCSSCHSVVYCSRECQKRDWIQRHRNECKDFHEVYIQRKHTDQWYSHPTRAFHLSILLDEFEDLVHPPSISSANASGKKVRQISPPSDNTPGTGTTAFLDPSKCIRVIRLTHKAQSTLTPLDKWLSTDGLWMTKVRKKRFRDMAARWELSHLPPASNPGHDLDRQSNRERSKRHLVDVHIEFGHLILHNVVLLREREVGQEAEEFSRVYDVEGSMVFAVPADGRSPYQIPVNPNNQLTPAKWLAGLALEFVKGISGGGWLAIGSLAVVASLVGSRK